MTSTQMKAVVWTAYGPPEVLELQRVDAPTPAPDEILIRVRAATVTAGDVEMRGFRFPGALGIPLRVYFGIFKPRGTRILGQELAGDIVAVGDAVTRFAVGERVFAQTGFRFGGYAEYSCLPEKGMVARIPDGVEYEEAATIPTAGQYGLFFTRRAGIRPGQTVLVNGGAGSIGSYAVQLAVRAGAKVTVVDRVDKSDVVLRRGAERFIDFTSEDFTNGDEQYDAILDVVDKSSFPRSARVLKPGGLYLHSDISLSHALRRGLYRAKEGRRSVFVSDSGDHQDLSRVADLIAASQLQAIVDRRFSLDAIVDAHHYAESGAKSGHIVVNVA